jgi:hypothetical protein
MEVRAFAVLVIPFILVVYLAILLFVRPPRAVLLASLLGGLLLGVLNLLTDLVAYYAHWWHYTINDLTFHLPLPFYITSVLVYGSIVYLLIWRFWTGRGRWFALLLLYGVPVLGIVRDITGNLFGTSYATYDSGFGIAMTIVMWLVMFYGGYFAFKYLAPPREVIEEEAHKQIS